MEPTVQQRAAVDNAEAKANLAANFLQVGAKAGLTSGGTTGTITDGGLLPQPSPSICPGCGRCRECGHPYPYAPAPYQVPYQPWYQKPFEVTCGSVNNPQTGTIAVNAQNNSAQ